MHPPKNVVAQAWEINSTRRTNSSYVTFQYFFLEIMRVKFIWWVPQIKFRHHKQHVPHSYFKLCHCITPPCLIILAENVDGMMSSGPVLKWDMWVMNGFLEGVYEFAFYYVELAKIGDDFYYADCNRRRFREVTLK